MIRLSERHCQGHCHGHCHGHAHARAHADLFKTINLFGWLKLKTAPPQTLIFQVNWYIQLARAHSHARFIADTQTVLFNVQWRLSHSVHLFCTRSWRDEIMFLSCSKFVFVFWRSFQSQHNYYENLFFFPIHLCLQDPDSDSESTECLCTWKVLYAYVHVNLFRANVMYHGNLLFLPIKFTYVSKSLTQTPKVPVQHHVVLVLVKSPAKKITGEVRLE